MNILKTVLGASLGIGKLLQKSWICTIFCFFSSNRVAVLHKKAKNCRKLSFSSLTFLLVTTLSLQLLFSVVYAQNDSAEHDFLVFSSSGQSPLHSTTNDGFLEAITREALGRIGYQLSVKIFPTERSIYILNKGLVDGEMSRIGGLEKSYPNIVHVPEKIYDTGFYVYSKTPIATDLGWESLANKKVAYIRGWKILDANVPKSAVVTKTKTSQQLLNLVNKGRVDCFIYSGWLNSAFSSDLKSNHVLQLNPHLAIEPMYMYLNKKHLPLVSKLNKVLVEMKKDGSYDALVEKYLEPLTAYNSVL